jgi:hypothetical protein
VIAYGNTQCAAFFSSGASSLTSKWIREGEDGELNIDGLLLWLRTVSLLL